MLVMILAIVVCVTSWVWFFCCFDFEHVIAAIAMVFGIFTFNAFAFWCASFLFF